MNNRTAFLCGATVVCLMGMGEQSLSWLETDWLVANDAIVVGKEEQRILIAPKGIIFVPSSDSQATFYLQLQDNALYLKAGDKVLQRWEAPGG